MLITRFYSLLALLVLGLLLPIAQAETVIELSPSPNADFYQVEVRAGTAEPLSYNVGGEILRLKLPLAPGTYELRTRSLNKGGTVGDWGAWQSFEVQAKVAAEKPPAHLPRLPDVELISPSLNSIIVPTDDLDTPVTFEWSGLADARLYLLYIYDSHGAIFASYKVTESRKVVELPHNMHFRWNAVALREGEDPLLSPARPETAIPFSITNYVYLKLAPGEEPAHIYGWGRYILSNADYTGRNGDWNSTVQQKIYAGQTEGAVGYWLRRSPFGWLLHGGLSGFRLDKSHYYVDAGLHFGHRKIFAGGGRLRTWLGLSYREAPEVFRNFYNNPNQIDVHRVRNYGPQLQMSYLNDFFNSDFGWHAFSTIYYGAESAGTPNHLKQIPQFTFTTGLFLTYKENPDRKWMAGYTFKQENVRYKSTSSLGAENSSSLTGHYFSLSVEFGLAEHYR